MTTTLLASFPSPSQGVWHLGPVPVRAYAVFIIIGIIAALLIGDRRWVARGGERGVIYDIALWAVPFGLVGGRLYHVMTDWKTYFGPDGAGPVAALRIWDGGLGIWGAVALGGVGAWIACRRRGIPLPAFGDAVAPGVVLAQAIGRLGNYFNQELYGRETTVPWGLEIFYRQDPSGIVDVHSLNGVSTGQVAAVVHPTFLYELLWNLLVFVVLIVIDRRFKIGHGRLFALYVALYCVGRFGVELLRADTATHIAGIRINSFTATFVFLGAVVYIILAKKGREDPSTLGGHHDPGDDLDHAHVPELAKELVEVAAGTGIVAAAAVAGQEDVESASEFDDDIEDEIDGQVAALDVLESVEESESVDEFEALDEAEPDEAASDDAESAEAEPAEASAEAPEADSESESDGEAPEPEVLAADADEPDAATADADDDEPDSAHEPDAEDEAVVEAELASPGVEIETATEVDEQVIDEDHDPVDEDELEGLSEAEVTSAPASEQEESLEADSEESEVAEAQLDSPTVDSDDADDTAAEGSTIVEASEESAVVAVESATDPDADESPESESPEGEAAADEAPEGAAADAAAEGESPEGEAADDGADEADAGDEGDQTEGDGDAADVEPDETPADAPIESEAAAAPGSRLSRLFRRRR